MELTIDLGARACAIISKGEINLGMFGMHKHKHMLLFRRGFFVAVAKINGPSGRKHPRADKREEIVCVDALEVICK